MPDQAERGPKLQGVGLPSGDAQGATRERLSEETDIAPPLGIRHLAEEVALIWQEARGQ